MRSALLLVAVLAVGCGSTQFITENDGGSTGGGDAGATSTGGGTTATGGGTADTGGGTAATGGGSTATGGGTTATGGGTTATGGGTTATGGGTAGTGGGAASCASSCTGCCDAADTCHPGTDAQACGVSGASCTACPTTELCGGDHACHLDPARTWKVRIGEARTSGSYDDTSSSDVEMTVWCPSGSSNSATMPKVQDSEHPVWTSGGCTLTAAELLSSGIDFKAIDVDLTSDDTITPRTPFLPVEAEVQAGSVTPTMTFGGLSSVTFVFTPQ